MIGSDGLPHDRHPHPRLWGTFPRVLARYCRERKLFPLELAIHKMTGLSSRNFRLHRRGLLQPGWYADIVVFDAARVRDRASYEQPHAISEGIAAVYVNGVPSWCGDGRDATGRAGRLLQRNSDIPE